VRDEQDEHHLVPQGKTHLHRLSPSNYCCSWAHRRTAAAAMQGLRLHDNPALLEAARGADHLCPIFILDPWFLKPDK
jgi:hypothetical protein